MGTETLRTTWIVFCFVLFFGSAAATAQNKNFAGFLGGISTLSADGRSVVEGDSLAASLYKPENGPTVQAVLGHHLSDYLSVQGTWGWNRNSLTLTSSGIDNVFYEQSRRASQHTFAGELMLYFRNRESWARPYLSVGGGVIQFDSDESTITQTLGQSPLSPSSFSSTEPALRVAVGIDILSKSGWAFRFTFSETIQNNPISAQLTPPAERNLANFQNFFGFVKYF